MNHFFHMVFDIKWWHLLQWFISEIKATNGSSQQKKNLYIKIKNIMDQMTVTCHIDLFFKIKGTHGPFQPKKNFFIEIKDILDQMMASCYDDDLLKLKLLMDHFQPKKNFYIEIKDIMNQMMATCYHDLFLRLQVPMGLTNQRTFLNWNKVSLILFIGN